MSIRYIKNNYINEKVAYGPSLAVTTILERSWFLFMWLTNSSSYRLLIYLHYPVALNDPTPAPDQTPVFFALLRPIISLITFAVIIDTLVVMFLFIDSFAFTELTCIEIISDLPLNVSLPFSNRLGQQPNWEKKIVIMEV